MKSMGKAGHPDLGQVLSESQIQPFIVEVVRSACDDHQGSSGSRSPGSPLPFR